MPIFEIQHPSGRTFEVDAPDQQAALSAFQRQLTAGPKVVEFKGQRHEFPAGTTDAQISAALGGWDAFPLDKGSNDWIVPGQKLGPEWDQFKLAEQPSAGGTAMDVLKSGGIGAVKGGIGLATVGGDIRDAALRGMGALGVPGTDLVNTGMRFLPSLLGGGPTSRQTQSGIEALSGQFYQPQTTAGEYAQTIGEFAPGAAAGPGGIARRVAAQVLAPALASETAGQAAKGTGYETPARIGGAVAGGLAGVRRGANAAIATADEIRDAGRVAYQQVRELGVEIAPRPVANVATRIEGELTDMGLTARNVPETYGVVRSLQNPPRGAVMRAQDFENARQELMQATQNRANPREAAAARTAINHLDNYLAEIPAQDVLRGDAAAARDLFRTARGNWAAASRADTVAGKIELGDLNAATANSGQNIDNATKQAIKQLIRPDNKGRTLAERMGFNADEIAQMNRVARGTFTGNVARFVSHIFGGGGGLGSFLTAGAGGLAVGPAGVALPAVGFAAKGISNASTARQARLLDEMVRRRSPLVAADPLARPTPLQIPGQRSVPLALIADRDREPRLSRLQAR